MTTEQQLQDVIAVLRAKRDEQKALRATKWHRGFKQEARGHREASKAYDRAVGLVKRITVEATPSFSYELVENAIGLLEEAIN